MAVTLLPNSSFKLAAADDLVALRGALNSITWVTVGTGGAFTGESGLFTTNIVGTRVVAASGAGISAYGSGTLAATAETHNLYHGIWIDGFRLLTLPASGYVVLTFR